MLEINKLIKRSLLPKANISSTTHFQLLQWLHGKQPQQQRYYLCIGGIIGGIIAGVITDRTGMSATVCSVMLVVAIPTMYLYENLVSDICPISQIQEHRETEPLLKSEPGPSFFQ